jgi:hypothetical protein
VFIELKSKTVFSICATIVYDQNIIYIPKYPIILFCKGYEKFDFFQGIVGKLLLEGAK